MSFPNNPPRGAPTSIGTVQQGGEQYTDSRFQDALVTETTGAGVYTVTFSLPEGARITDIGAQCVALWTATTSAAMIAGDDADPDGFFTSTDLKATDLIVGESNTIEHPGGKAGAYIVSEQRLLQTAQQRNVVFSITTVGGAGNAGRTYVYVEYAPHSGRGASKV